jgi:hypothetical protein
MLNTILLTILKITGVVFVVGFVAAILYGFWKFTKWTFKNM